MQINSFEIHDFPPFKNFSVSFEPSVTVIAGPNGVGKSRLMAAIIEKIQQGEGQHDPRFSVSTKDYSWDGMWGAFSAQRQIPYLKIESLQPISMQSSGYRHYLDHKNLSNSGASFKYWFIHRYIAEKVGWSNQNARSGHFNLAKQLFSLLDSSYVYKEVTEDFEIILDTPHGDVRFEDTSAGFQSTYLLLHGILVALEYISSNYDTLSFRGVIFIDEIDIHLHPTWQSQILRHLQDLLPLAQIIATTHSPHVIQGLKENEVIVLGVAEDGYSRIKSISPKPGPYGFQGWTIEEILRDVMGLDDTVTSTLAEAENGFNAALDEENVEAARPHFDRLMTMLHPRNPMRKIYTMQFDSIGGLGE